MSARVAATPVLGDVVALVRIGWPLILNNLFNIGISLADNIMAGRLGARTLAAVALGSSIWITLFLAGLGVMMAIGPTVAQHYGAGRLRQIGHDTRQGLWLGVIVGCLVIAMMRSASPVMSRMGIDPAVVILAQGYLDAMSFGVFGCYWYHALRQMNEGLGRTVPIMLIMGTSVPINIALNYTFMYGSFGFPALGAVGAGLGSGITFWLMFLFIATYTARSPYYRRFDLVGRLAWPNLATLGHLLAVGGPIGLSLMLQAGLFTTAALIMGSMGTHVVAAHAVTINFAGVVFMVPMGIGMAATVLVGQAVGRGEPRIARRIGFTAIGLCFALMCMTATATFVFALPIAGLYTHDPQVIALAGSLLAIAALLELGDGTQVTAGCALRGFKDTRVPLLFNAFAYWVIGFGAAVTLYRGFGLGPQGVWLGLTACMWSATAFLTWRFHVVTARAIARGPAAAESGDAIVPLGETALH